MSEPAAPETAISNLIRPLPPLPPPLPPPEIDPDHLELEALKVIARLKRHGYEAFLVGGCVRDLLVGAEPKDFDVVTSAHPDEIRSVFRNSRLIGRRFRLAHVFYPGGRIVEVATFRANPAASIEAPIVLPLDGALADGSSELAPEVIEPAGDLLVTEDNQFGTAEEDARRRDFTINGLFYDVQDGRVIDFVNGRADLDARYIRTIGDPEIRLREDPVRGLRAARIAAKLSFGIHPETFDAMARHAGELPRCAPARVLEETLKLLRAGSSRRAFEFLRQAGLLKVLLPPVEEALGRGGPAAEQEFYARLGLLDGLIGERRPVTDAVMLATLLSFLPDPSAAPRAGGEEESDEEEDEISDENAVILPSADRVLAQMSAHARLPRRVADRVRAIIASQRLFTSAPKRKRRRGGSGGFVRTPHFLESLLLFELSVRATGRHADVLERWKLKYVASLEQQAAAVESRAVEARLASEARAAEPKPAPAPRPAPPKTPAVPHASAPVAAEAPAADAGDIPAEATPAVAKKRRRRGGRRHRSAGAGATESGAESSPSDEAGGSDSGDSGSSADE